MNNVAVIILVHIIWFTYINFSWVSKSRIAGHAVCLSSALRGRYYQFSEVVVPFLTPTSEV